MIYLSKLAATQCDMIIPYLELFAVDVNHKEYSSLENQFNLYSIFHKHIINYNQTKRKESEDNDFQVTPKKKLKYAEISDSELVACEIQTSATRIKQRTKVKGKKI
jgi:hypothetical protein